MWTPDPQQKESHGFQKGTFYFFFRFFSGENRCFLAFLLCALLLFGARSVRTRVHLQRDKKIPFPPTPTSPTKVFFSSSKVRIHPHPSLFIPLFSANKKGGVKEKWIENSKAPPPFLLRRGGKNRSSLSLFPQKREEWNPKYISAIKMKGKRRETPQKKSRTKIQFLAFEFFEFRSLELRVWEIGGWSSCRGAKKVGGPPFLSLLSHFRSRGEREALKKINLLAQYNPAVERENCHKKVNVFSLIILRFLRKKGNVFLISSS